MTFIDQLASGLTIGHGNFAKQKGFAVQLDKVCHDGDTISFSPIGNASVRMLNIDTAEVSFTLPPENKKFVSISDAAWKKFLTDPFAAEYGPLHLDPGLMSYLKKKKLGANVAANHSKYAGLGRTILIEEVKADMKAMNWTNETFEFFLSFAHEVVDRYGRLLAFINRKDPSTKRPADYNLRQLEKGAACAYFIWPNVGKFTGAGSLNELVPKPGTANHWASTDKYLKQTREATVQARQKQIGIFDKTDPLQIEPFELRYLAQRRAPDRWVIDLSKNDVVLIAPQHYYTIPHMEDRLFVAAEHVPLFVAKGWRQQQVVAVAARTAA